MKIESITFPPTDAPRHLTDEETKQFRQTLADDVARLANCEVAAPRRGRKPLATAARDQETEALVEAAQRVLEPMVDEMRRENVTLPKGELAQSLNVAHGMGMFQALDYVQKFSGLARLKWLAERKESGDYKGATVMREGALITLNTFEDLCSFVGHSRRKIDEDLQNLTTFGEGMLAAQEALGLGYRELRLLRAGIKALPPEERQRVLEEIQTAEGGDEAKEKLDELSVRLAQARVENAELRADMEAKERLSRAKSERLDKLQERMLKLTSLEPDKQAQARREKALEARKALDLACHEVLGVLNRVLGAAQAILRDDGMDAATKMFTHERVGLMCDLAADAILRVGIDVDFTTRFTVEYGPDGDPAMVASDASEADGTDGADGDAG